MSIEGGGGSGVAAAASTGVRCFPSRAGPGAMHRSASAQRLAAALAEDELAASRKPLRPVEEAGLG